MSGWEPEDVIILVILGGLSLTMVLLGVAALVGAK